MEKNDRNGKKVPRIHVRSWWAEEGLGGAGWGCGGHL